MIAALRRLFGRKPAPTVETVESAPTVRDPFADHPMYCKCYFHR